VHHQNQRIIINKNYREEKEVYLQLNGLEIK